MNVIWSHIDNTLSKSNDWSDCVIFCKDVENSIEQLKWHKADILSGLYSDHLIYGGYSLNGNLIFLLSTIQLWCLFLRIIRKLSQTQIILELLQWVM